MRHRVPRRDETTRARLHRSRPSRCKRQFEADALLAPDARRRIALIAHRGSRHANPTGADPRILFPAAKATPGASWRNRHQACFETRAPPEGASHRYCQRAASGIFVASRYRAPSRENGQLALVTGDRSVHYRTFLVRQARVAARLLEAHDLPEGDLLPSGGEAVFAEAIQRERLVDAADSRPCQDEPDPAVPIGRPQDRLVEPAVPEKNFAADGRQTEDEVSAQQLAPLILDLEAPAAVVA